MSFLYGRVAGGEHTALARSSDTPEQLVDNLKKLSASERSARVASEVAYLASEPLNIDAINNIALLEALGDNSKKSESIVVEAARRSLRDIQLQLSAVNTLLGKRNYAQALFHIDGLMRSQPELSEQLFKVLVQLQQDPTALANVATLLKGNPPWRWQYVASVIKDDATGQGTFQLLSAIRKSGGSVSDGEFRNYIGTQIGKKNYDIAYFTWLDSLDEEALRSVSLVYDGKFERSPRNQYFDWTISPYPNANIGIAAKPGDPSNQVLRIDFLGGRDAFGHVQQYLRLTPGEYEASGEWRAENFQSPSGLRWQVYCIGGAASSPPSKLLSATGSWDKFSFPVTVPPENCDTQLLQLQSASAAALDQRFEGQVYFDNIVVEAKSPAPIESGDP